MLALAMITAAITLLRAYFLVRISWSLSREPLLVVAVVAGTMLTSYLLLFSLDRGQMEPIMMRFVLLFLVCFILRKYWRSALCLALAAASSLCRSFLFHTSVATMTFQYRVRYFARFPEQPLLTCLMIVLSGMRPSVIPCKSKSRESGRP
jgi:hypothetical protein